MSDGSDDASSEEDCESGDSEADFDAPGPSAAGIYAIRARGGMVYVGKSQNMARRLAEHQRGAGGARLTRLGLLTQGSVHDLESWERNEVLTRMLRYGLNSTRGWRFTRRGPLTRQERLAARADIMEKFDLCRRCGRASHFAAQCFARSAAAWCEDVGPV